MIQIEEIRLPDIKRYWDAHKKYMIEDGIIHDKEDIAYFTGKDYRTVIENHMMRDVDKHHLVYFCRNGQKIGAASYCTYKSEDGKCFILDFWVFSEFRGNGTGHECFFALEQYTKQDGAVYYEINSEKEDSVRFWKSLGFTENGIDEYDMPLFIRK